MSAGTESTPEPDDGLQVMPDLSDEEYRALKEDIRENGVKVPVVVDEDDQIIDGHHRVRACEELGIEDYPVRAVYGKSDAEKQRMAWRLNMQRRHFGNGEKRDRVKDYLLTSWDGEPEREVADLLGVSQMTVNRAKEELLDDGKLKQVSQFSKEEKRQQVREYINENPDASNREVADAIEADVSHATVGNWRNKFESDEDGGDDNSDGAPEADEAKSFDRIFDSPDDHEKASEVWDEAQDGDEDAQEELGKVQEGEQSVDDAADAVEQKRREQREQAERERREAERQQQYEDAIKADETIDVYHGDFTEICESELEPESVDHIVTDPPYGEDAIPAWRDLGRVANRVLKPGGFCIAYSGKYHLPAVIDALDESLDYYWQCIVHHDGPGAKFFARDMRTNYKPVLVFQKPPETKQEDFVTDVIQGAGREKDSHDWQQAEAEAAELVERFTDTNDRILDPMCGSGTTGVAAKRLSRRCVLIDRDEDALAEAKGRVSDGV